MEVLIGKSERHQNPVNHEYSYETGSTTPKCWVDRWMDESYLFFFIYLFIFKYPLTALNLQRAGLGVQRETAQVHVAHGSNGDSAEGNRSDIKRNTHCNAMFSGKDEGEIHTFVYRLNKQEGKKSKCLCKQQVIKPAENIIATHLLSVMVRCLHRAKSILDTPATACSPSGYRNMRCCATRLQSSFYPQTATLLNSSSALH